MNLELSKEDLRLLNILLSKEIEETRTEIHYADRLEYKDFLKIREDRLNDLLTKIRNAQGAISRPEEEVKI